jgi:nucleotide-binding universal stress UspA family protein
MKKILIAIDYDPAAQRVAELGYSLAKELKAEVTLIHVISNPLYYSVSEFEPMGFIGYNDLMLTNNIIDSLRDVGHEFLNKAKIHLADDSIQTLVREGDFADSILEAANELSSDIIVLGTHGRKWYEKILVGSVAEKVLQHSTKPIYLLPTAYHNK